MKKRERLIWGLEIDRLHEVLDYNPKTGIFTWRKRLSPRCRFDMPAGSIHPDGYRRIAIDKVIYQAHLLAWFHFYGVAPEYGVNHKNSKKDDNRIKNLREATHAESKQHTGRLANNTSGFKGVSLLTSPWKLRKPYRALIRHGGKRIFIGAYATAEEAAAAYRAKAKELHKDFANA